jgi:hypothetical protein
MIEHAANHLSAKKVNVQLASLEALNGIAESGGVGFLRGLHEKLKSLAASSNPGIRNLVLDLYVKMHAANPKVATAMVG